MRGCTPCGRDAEVQKDEVARERGMEPADDCCCGTRSRCPRTGGRGFLKGMWGRAELLDSYPDLRPKLASRKDCCRKKVICGLKFPKNHVFNPPAPAEESLTGRVSLQGLPAWGGTHPWACTRVPGPREL